MRDVFLCVLWFSFRTFLMLTIVNFDILIVFKELIYFALRDVVKHDSLSIQLLHF